MRRAARWRGAALGAALGAAGGAAAAAPPSCPAAGCPASQSALVLGAATDLQIASMECAVLEMDMPMDQVLLWQTSWSPQAAQPQLLLSQNRRPDGNCWVSPEGSQGGTACEGCMILWSVQPLEDQCRTDPAKIYVEILNTGPDTLSFQYSGAAWAAPGTNAFCLDPAAMPDPDQCRLVDLPSCKQNGDGTGGSVSGLVGGGYCECLCLQGWSGTDCDTYDTPPAPPPRPPPMPPPAPPPPLLAPSAAPAAQAQPPPTAAPAAQQQPPPSSGAGAAPVDRYFQSPAYRHAGSPAQLSALEAEEEDGPGLWWIGVLVGLLCMSAACAAALYALAQPSIYTAESPDESKCKALVESHRRPREHTAEFQAPLAFPDSPPAAPGSAPEELGPVDCGRRSIGSEGDCAGLASTLV